MADVRVGNVAHKTVDECSGNETFTELRKAGYDSVRIHGLRTGEEIVVYNYDQVLNVRRQNSVADAEAERERAELLSSLIAQAERQQAAEEAAEQAAQQAAERQGAERMARYRRTPLALRIPLASLDILTAIPLAIIAEQREHRRSIGEMYWLQSVFTTTSHT